MSNARSSASVRVTGRYLSSEQMFSTVVPCGTRTTRVNKFLSFLLSLSYMDSIRKHPPAGGKPCLISTLSEEQICSHSDMPDRHDPDSQTNFSPPPAKTQSFLASTELIQHLSLCKSVLYIKSHVLILIKS